MSHPICSSMTFSHEVVMLYFVKKNINTNTLYAEKVDEIKNINKSRLGFTTMLPQSMIVTGMKRNERTYYKLFSNTKASKFFLGI